MVHWLSFVAWSWGVGGGGWGGVEWSGVEEGSGRVSRCPHLTGYQRWRWIATGDSSVPCPLCWLGWGLPNIQIKRAGGSSVWSVFVTSSVHPLHPVGETKGLGNGKFYFFNVITCYDGSIRSKHSCKFEIKLCVFGHSHAAVCESE